MGEADEHGLDERHQGRDGGFGLAIGLSALELLQKQVDEDRHRVLASDELRARLRSLAPQAALASFLTTFWLDPDNRDPRT